MGKAWSSGHSMVEAKGSSSGGDTYQTFCFSNDFYFSVLKAWRNWPTLPAKHHCSRRNSNVR